MDLSKRANLRGVREERGALRVADSPSGMLGADWGDLLTLRADGETDTHWQFAGEASIVDHPYTVYDMFGEYTETVRPGSFTHTLANDPLVSFVYMHDLATTMAQTRGRNLTLSETPHLGVEALLDKSDVDAQRVVPKIRSGMAASMSFAFRVTRQEWNEDYTEREILEVNLHGGDVSVIATGHGANPAAHGNMRALDLDAVLAFLDSDDDANAALALRFAPEIEPVPVLRWGGDINALSDRMRLDALLLDQL